MQAADDAIQIHGSYGFSNEYPVERFMRNARGSVIYEGTSQIHQILQAEYALGYREDRPLRHPQPPARASRDRRQSWVTTVILGGARTPFGRINGALASKSGVELGSIAATRQSPGPASIART
jgi:hypothetical protein